MSSKLTFYLLVCAAVGACMPGLAYGGASCESLSGLKLQDTTVTGAGTVAAGPFELRGGGPAASRSVDLPAFCKVQLTVAPAVKIEVWLPMTNWNGNFEAVGNGGFAGVIGYAAMATALKAGYATASTDTGHEGNNADFASGDPKDPTVQAKIVDFGYLAIHEMTVKGKQVIQAFYGAGPKFSYFNGCSQGGRQAFTEAQRYPADYNGILAGSPGINNTNLMVAHLAVGLDTLKDEESYIPREKLPAIQAASVAACDELDGLKDNLVSDPRKCKFDPEVLLCKGADSASCLTAKQVQTLKALYANVTYPDGKLIYPGRLPGAEKNWGNFTTGAAPYKGTQYTYGVTFMRNFIYKDPNWDFRSWDFAKGMPLVDSSPTREILDSTNPNLKPFKQAGGKLITYQGWGDDDVSPINTVNYYKTVVAAVTGVGKGTDAYTPETAEFDQAAEKTGTFLRLFMVPGMGHCGGGDAPSVFDGMGALSAWVEKQQAPDKMIASHSTNDKVDRTRPLCPYPQAAQYSGQGSIDDAANFACQLPKAGGKANGL